MAVAPGLHFVSPASLPFQVPHPSGQQKTRWRLESAESEDDRLIRTTYPSIYEIIRRQTQDHRAVVAEVIRWKAAQQ